MVFKIFKTDWNHLLPDKEARDYREFITTTQCIIHIAMNSYVLSENYSETQIRGFSDTSQQAYGAAVHLRLYPHHN